MQDIPFVDAHVHYWELARIEYPWLAAPFDDVGPNGSVEAIARDYLPEAHLREVFPWSLAGAVHVEAGAAPARALAETDWLETVATRTGLPNAIVAHVALDGEDVETALAEQAARSRVRGVRQIVNWHPDPARTYGPVDRTLDERWERGFGMLARHDLSFDLQCYPGQTGGFVHIAERHPDVPIVINHLGMPVLTDPDGLQTWRDGMRRLAGLPQTAVKLSGLGFVRRSWTAAEMLPLLRETLDLFGTRRCMVATDLPTDRLFAPAERYREVYAELLGDLSDDERRDLMGRNANRIYRLDLSL